MNALSGGKKLEAYMRHLSKQADKSAMLRVGFLEGSGQKGGLPTPAVAAIQEFGAPKAGIPPRPFFRTMIAEEKDTWGPKTGDRLKANNFDAEKTLGEMGGMIAGQLQQSIRDLTDPPLSPVTLLLRQRFGNHPEEITGSDVAKARHDIAAGKAPSVTATQAKPLIWTGNLLASVNFDVKT